MLEKTKIYKAAMVVMGSRRVETDRLDAVMPTRLRLKSWAWSTISKYEMIRDSTMHYHNVLQHWNWFLDFEY